jgi:outer membrane protein OmpA-like peptidoglycan-associated protein
MKQISSYRIAIAVCVALAASAQLGRAAEPRGIDYSITQGAPVPLAAHRATLPLVIYAEASSKPSPYSPSGFMGDGGTLKIITAKISAPTENGSPGATSLKVIYNGKGRDGWSGIYWLTPANNWGRIKGAGYDLSAAKQLTFWACGDKGGETIAEIKVGGITGPYADTDAVTKGPIRLSRDWKKFTVDLAGRDLRHIVGGFGFIIRRADNPRGAIIYLDEIRYESEATTSNPTSNSTSPVPARGVVGYDAPEFGGLKVFNIPFSGDTRDFRVEASKDLDTIVAIGRSYPSARIEIIGYTDGAGNREIEKQISVERAKAVAEYLQSKGVDAARMTVDGRGAASLPGPRQQDRRVEVTVREN